jgi:REP element-mobilizing transposase RayT
MDDHIHLLIRVPPPLSLAKAVLAIKSIRRDGRTSKATNSRGNKVMRRSA